MSYDRTFLQEVIDLYRSLPALWKINLKENSDRTKKVAGYEILIEKFRTIDPHATRETVTKKINSLRTARQKEKKKVKDSN